MDPYFPSEKETSLLSPGEIIFMKNNPDSIVVIQSSACRSLAISYALCGVKPVAKEFSRAWDEEADAIRHFIFSSFLTCSRGQKFAESYTMAHEGDPDWDEASEMDIANNRVGMSWAKTPGRCALPLTDERMARASLKLLMENKFQTLRSGDTLCARPERLRQLNWDEFHLQVNQVHLQLQRNLKFCHPRFGRK